jgi:uncharacterized phiE125 gp8 family phage protein
MLRIVDKASTDSVSLAEAKAQLRVTDTSNDVLIKALIPAATNFVQSLVQHVFVSQTLEWVLSCWRDELCIPVAPVTKDGIASIKYVDWVTQSQHTLDPALYVVQTSGRQRRGLSEIRRDLAAGVFLFARADRDQVRCRV